MATKLAKYSPTTCYLRSKTLILPKHIRQKEETEWKTFIFEFVLFRWKVELSEESNIDTITYGSNLFELCIEITFHLLRNRTKWIWLKCVCCKLYNLHWYGVVSHGYKVSSYAKNVQNNSSYETNV